MHSLAVTHAFMRKLTRNIRDAYGRDVPSTRVLELVSDALGFKAGPLMHALKSARSAELRHAAPASVHGSSAPAGRIPPLSELRVLSGDDLEFVRNIGRRRSGLVVITGATGSGKTTLANSMVKQWVEDTGNVGFAVGELVEYPGLRGRHARGLIIQEKTGRGQAVMGSADAIVAYDPAYVVVEDHLYRKAPGKGTNGREMASVLEMVKDRVVVVSGYWRTRDEFLSQSAADLADYSGNSPDAAALAVRRDLLAVVGAQYHGSQGGEAFKARMLK